jgi:hypothetical protein
MRSPLPIRTVGVLLDGVEPAGLGDRTEDGGGVEGDEGPQVDDLAEIPSAARRSAASSALGTISASATMVQSVALPHDLGLAQLVDDLAIGHLALGGEQRLVLEEHHRVGVADRGRQQPTTSAGVDGATTLRPGIIMHQFSTDWECWAPKRLPPPLAVRTTTGTDTWPPVMYRALAISLATMSKHTARKSENMISAITGTPVIAAPMAAPRMACSEIGVSRIASGRTRRAGPRWS